MFEFSELPSSRKVILEPMNGNVVICVADVPMYVVVRKAEKHVPCGESVVLTDSMMLQPRCRANEVVITDCNSIRSECVQKRKYVSIQSALYFCQNLTKVDIALHILLVFGKSHQCQFKLHGNVFDVSPLN